MTRLIPFLPMGGNGSAIQTLDFRPQTPDYFTRGMDS